MFLLSVWKREVNEHVIHIWFTTREKMIERRRSNFEAKSWTKNGRHKAILKELLRIVNRNTPNRFEDTQELLEYGRELIESNITRMPIEQFSSTSPNKHAFYMFSNLKKMPIERSNGIVWNYLGENFRELRFRVHWTNITNFLLYGDDSATGARHDVDFAKTIIDCVYFRQVYMDGLSAKADLLIEWILLYALTRVYGEKHIINLNVSFNIQKVNKRRENLAWLI